MNIGFILKIIIKFKLSFATQFLAIIIKNVRECIKKDKIE